MITSTTCCCSTSTQVLCVALLGSHCGQTMAVPSSPTWTRGRRAGSLLTTGWRDGCLEQHCRLTSAAFRESTADTCVSSHRSRVTCLIRLLLACALRVVHPTCMSEVSLSISQTRMTQPTRTQHLLNDLSDERLAERNTFGYLPGNPYCDSGEALRQSAQRYGCACRLTGSNLCIVCVRACEPRVGVPGVPGACVWSRRTDASLARRKGYHRGAASCGMLHVAWDGCRCLLRAMCFRAGACETATACARCLRPTPITSSSATMLARACIRTRRAAHGGV
jgi:hypothetical protein